MLHPIKTSEIPWIVEAASRFSEWLLRTPGKTWTAENLNQPGIYRWTVSFICYEGLFEDLRSERWFQAGTRAFGLMALEHEGKIEILRSEPDDGLHVRSPAGAVFELEAFLNGESLSVRHDPEFADLSWDPVSAIGHVLFDYDDD